MNTARHLKLVVNRGPQSRRGWELSEETMPQSIVHNESTGSIEAVLSFWAHTRANTRIARDLAIRWDERNPKIGVDPDVCVLCPAPPLENGDLRSVRTWIPGHEAPIFAVEVVSNTNPRKDYEMAPEKYAASGTGELCIFDPMLAGPRSHGGPYRLQLWRRGENGEFRRVYAGSGPVYSPALNGYLVPIEKGRKLRIADDEAGLHLWPTAEEAERAEKEVERKAKEEERAAKEEALARIALLEAALCKATKESSRT
ncbi:MAG: Uma2 family endonuclease [Polyangiaceae bacterium]|nr:Uma2 family endonuclease [Polyangiaceae bacterium]